MAARRYKLTEFKTVGTEIYWAKAKVGTLDYFIARLEADGYTRVKQVKPGVFVTVDKLRELRAL
jgi:hypothetical protein